MGTAANPNTEMTSGSSSQAGTSGQSTSGVGSPITNEAYNVITALQAKLEGLEAYRKYAQNDGNTGVWQELTRADVASVERLVDELEKLVRDGQFRLKEPGRANA